MLTAHVRSDGGSSLSGAFSRILSGAVPDRLTWNLTTSFARVEEERRAQRSRV